MDINAVQTDYRSEIKRRMDREGIPDLAIRTFLHYYEKLLEGATGMIPESSIQPVAGLPDLENLASDYEQTGAAELSKTVILKLNGGLGTSMGLQDAKSLLEVRGEQTFLDIIARQAEYWQVPLVLMNSFSTAPSSRAHLRRYERQNADLPVDFLQHKIPKLTRTDAAPVSWDAQPELAWCPPGHGDIYTALLTTGTLSKLRQAGFNYLFVSNSDNLGAVVDKALLGYFCKENLTFMMEVANRTFADRKGGHLALKEDGGFLLRESAQCPPESTELFQDIDRHRYFNTNNLWIRLDALDELLERKNGILDLPMICNAKTVDPRDSASTPVYQLETAMGAAISVFENAGAIRVPRTRFAPVKTTNELLAVRSDAYVLNEDHTLTLHPERAGTPCVISLDRNYYKTVDDIATRFPSGPPSLLECNSLSVEGDVVFGAGTRCSGDVRIVNTTSRQIFIEDERMLSGDHFID